MTYRQSILMFFYPLLMLKGKLYPAKTDILFNEKKIIPPVSFYGLQAVSSQGDTINFNRFKEKKVLIVNTASDCGYTGQYAELETLYQQNRDRLVIIGFPANDFKQQEKKNDDEIAQFCKSNYGITFLLMKKSSVIKGTVQNEVFEWLTDPAKNGWNTQEPKWNFNKYLITENGVLSGYFAHTVSPMDEKVMNALR